MLEIGKAKIADTVKFHVDETAVCVIEDGVEIRDNVVIECGAGGHLRVSSGTIINYGSWVNGSGKVTIGENVMIAPNVSITSSTHRYNLQTPIKDQGLRLAEVTIGDDVWIGTNVSVLAGAVVGNGSIVAANAVVKFNIAPNSIAAGDPAIRVASRKFKRVVFYTLPLILREQPTLFSSIVDVYLPLANKFASDGWECIFVGSDALRDEYPEFSHTWISPASLGFDYPGKNDPEWMSHWTCLLNNQPLAFHDRFVESLIETVSPDLVFCWNHDGSLETACATKEIPLLFNELGMLRAPNPMAYYSDTRGVNVRSGFSIEFADYQAKQLEPPSDIAFEHLQEMEDRYRFRGGAQVPTLLILLQVQDDSNIIMGSPFASMTEYVHHIYDVVKDSGFRVLVKPHPLDEVPTLPDYVLVADKDDSIAALISAADVVFTINSSAGFEAALAGKTVYTLGKAPYSLTGLTIDVSQPAHLAVLWQKHKAVCPCSRSLRAQVLDFSLTHYFLDEAHFIEPSSHLGRLARTVPSDLSRSPFDADLESYRQQSYIAWLEEKNRELAVELSSLSQHGLSINSNAAAEEVQALRSEIGSLKEQLSSILSSNSWRLTRPLRGGRRLFPVIWRVQRWGVYLRYLLRPAYQRLPFLIGLRMKGRNSLKGVRSGFMRVFNSQQNLKAIQAMAGRRFERAPTSLKVDAQPMIDVSVVTYNSAKWIDGFFESLEKQNYPLKSVALCFVDNGSLDTTVVQLQRWKTLLGKEVADFKIIQGENVGFGRGHDRAIKTGQADFVLVSNIDIVFAQDSISKVVAAAASDTVRAVASWELRQAPYEHPKYYDPVTHETNWSSHACILIRRSAYTDVGGYEREIFMYGEDVELSYRFRSYGYLLKYCPAAVVHHYTYEHENHVKPVQFTGSTLANTYLRLRYGGFSDRLGALVLQVLLLFRPQVYSGARLDLIYNLGKIIRKAPHFLLGKGTSKDVYFPFRGFDYEMIRDGAFWKVGEPLAAMPLVTIVTRTYRKRNEFLRQAIISVLNQTYPNVELIVVEDGGETMKELVAECQRQDRPSIRYYGMDKVGRSVTGNFGLEMARGTYCMFLDDDDLLFSDHVEVLVTALANNPTAVGAYSLAMEVGTVTAANGTYTEVSHETPSYFRHEYNYDILLDHNFIPIQSLLFRRDLYLQRGGFETDMSNLEDWNLWLRYGFGNQFTYVPKTTSLFRTPADPNVRLERHKLLHEAYSLAKGRAAKSCEGYLLTEG
ncbi:glycosyltransferase [Pseudomonas sp. SMV71]|uniref:glycosyltransferase n=1 Tax=Pseudomonas sp. SMV71 TaxID=3390195 RepID=UPI003F87911F